MNMKNGDRHPMLFILAARQQQSLYWIAGRGTFLAIIPNKPPTARADKKNLTRAVNAEKGHTLAFATNILYVLLC